MNFLKYKNFISGLLMAGIVIAGLSAVCGSVLSGSKAGNFQMQMKQVIHVAGFEKEKCCEMGVMDHTPLVKIFSSALVAGFFGGLLAMLLVFALAILSFIVSAKDSRLAISQYYYYLKQFLIKPYNYLQEAFSQGILNPKIFQIQ